MRLQICANDRVHNGPMVVFVCLHIKLTHYHHNADVSEGIGFLTYLSGTVCLVCVYSNVSCVSIQMSFMQYMGLCVFGLPISLMMIVRISVFYINIIMKSEVWPICHCLGLDHEIVVCVVCLSIFLLSSVTLMNIGIESRIRLWERVFTKIKTLFET